MAQKPRMVDVQGRERRLGRYTAAKSIGSLFPKVKELSLDLRFTETDQKPLLSPYRQIYTADMQAFFEVQCPSKDCKGEGFDLQSAVAGAAGRSDGTAQGRIACRGVGLQGAPCPVELVYKIVAAKS